MATIKSSFLNMLLTLTVITLLAGVALGFVYNVTKKPIEKAALAKQLKAIESVIKGYNNNPVSEKHKVPVPGRADSLEFFPAKQGEEFIGVAVKTKSAKGYSGDIWLMVGFNKDGSIQNIFVIQHLETPGLGSKMTEPFFLDQYRGKHPAKNNLNVRKDGGEVDAISGATISSRAFSEAVLEAYKTFEKSEYGNK